MLTLNKRITFLDVERLFFIVINVFRNPVYQA